MDRVLVLIAGPSGAGKDTLLRGAQEFFKGDRRVKFIRRCITRKPDRDEENFFLTEEEFENYRTQELFLSHWEAHGYSYGILKDDLINGVNVISVSRTVIDELSGDNARVIEITADRESIRGRLGGRGRENNQSINERMNRHVNYNNDNILKLENIGTPKEGVKKLTDYISSFLLFLT